MGNRTKRTHRNDRDGRTKRTELPSTTQIIHLFRLHYTPERIVQHSRSDFFDLKRKNGESAADVWKRILEVEKNCKFENITAVEALASKFLSLIEKSTGDYKLKKKIRKSDKSVEAITDAIHEYMYEKLNHSPETHEKKVIYIEKRKFTLTKKQADKNTKFGKNRRGAPNWSKQHECPARGTKCAKCGEPGHNTKCCRSRKKN